MRALFLLRQPIGGTATFCRTLAAETARFGVEATIDESWHWIPDQTGARVDATVSQELKKRAAGYDLVVAFGYRSAWACSEAFYLRSPWLYVAYDLPKTTNHQLIDRLCAARAGVCSTRAVKKLLEDSFAVNLEQIYPTCTFPVDVYDRDEARRQIGVSHDAKFVMGMGRWVDDHGFGVLARSFSELSAKVPGFQGAILGDGPAKVSGDFLSPGWPADAWQWLAAADLVVVPSRRAGFSMTALEAMVAGRAVLARRVGGLVEMGTHAVSLEFFESDDELTEAVSDLLDAPIHLASLGQAARSRAYERFGPGDCARSYSELFHETLS